MPLKRLSAPPRESFQGDFLASQRTRLRNRPKCSQLPYPVGYVMAIVWLLLLSLLSLFNTIVESVFCSLGVHRNGERVVHRRLNNRPKGFVLCRMTVLETIFKPTGVADETMYRTSTVCIPIVNKVESDNTFEISLPAYMASLHQNELDSGRLFVNISHFTLGDIKLSTCLWNITNVCSKHPWD
jgi:hypothetical protein